MHLSKILSLAAFLVAAVLLQPSGAIAAPFSVSPLSISLTGAPYGDIIVKNLGQERESFTVHARAWTQDSRGQQLLGAESGILFFPQVFSLKPGATQRVRLGAATGDEIGDIERAYRVLITQLPPSRAGVAIGPSINFATTIDVPLFQRASAVEPATSTLFDASTRGNSVIADLSNNSVMHIAPSSLDVVAFDASGRKLWAHDATVWYILAHSQTSSTVALPGKICAQTRQLKVSWIRGQEPAIVHDLAFRSTNCR